MTLILFQVMQSVLNFFGVYIFHFMGYAIAFHVLLPQTDDFKSIGDGTLKVNMNANAKRTFKFIKSKYDITTYFLKIYILVNLLSERY